jgi:hypothetical protein
MKLKKVTTKHTHWIMKYFNIVKMGYHELITSKAAPFDVVTSIA